METKKTNWFEPYNEFQTKGRQKVTGIHITGWKRKCGVSLLEQYANATNARGALFRQASNEARMKNAVTAVTKSELCISFQSNRRSQDL